MADKIYRVYNCQGLGEVYHYKNDGSAPQQDLIKFKKSMKEKGFKLIQESSMHNADYRRLFFKKQ